MTQSTEVSLTILGLLAASIALLFFVCKKKAWRYFFALALAVFIIVECILPLISMGGDPIVVTLIASLPIIIVIIYCSEGFTPLSHISMLVTLFSFAITALLIYVSVSFTHLTGIVSDVADMVGGERGIDLAKLLSAGIMLSSLGAIIEMSITQVATVMQFISSNPTMDKKQIYAQSNEVGVAHLGAIISTLFLLYAGVSLPLLILFASPGSSVSSLLNYEPFSSEVIRMLAGIIGLIIAMPISTGFTIWWLKRRDGRKLENK